jgi:hypothetical protein
MSLRTCNERPAPQKGTIPRSRVGPETPELSPEVLNLLALEQFCIGHLPLYMPQLLHHAIG